MQAQDVMTTNVASIRREASVREAAKRMAEQGISALPVVDAKGRVVGIVSEGDLVRRPELGTDVPRSGWLAVFGEGAAREYLRIHGDEVRNVMTRKVVSVRCETPLHEVARLLDRHRIKRVPVIEGGRLVGIVSRADLVRQLAAAPRRPAGRTAGDRETRRRVLEALQRSGAQAERVNATVAHGIVHLWGGVPSRAGQRLLCAAARGVRGVKKVEDHTSVIPLRAASALGLV
jgi:CBS domain-containing protein